MTRQKSPVYIRQHRIRVAEQRIPLTVACLWPKDGLNLGTIARTCDAVGARLVIPNNEPAKNALKKGNTIGLENTVHETLREPELWLRKRAQDYRIVAVELAHGSFPIHELRLARYGTVLLVGHENHGVPDWALELCDEIVEIPMSGVGNSLNVAVAASMAIYKLAGLI